MGFLLMPLYQVENFPVASSLLSVFIVNKFTFSMSVMMIVWFLSFILLIWHIYIN